MKKSRIIKRAVVLAVLIFAVSALASYTITYIANYRKDPLEGTWVSEDMDFNYAVVFKDGKTYTQIDMSAYSPMEYRILSAEEDDGNMLVRVYLYDDSISRQEVYEICDGDTMVYGDMMLKKQ